MGRNQAERAVCFAAALGSFALGAACAERSAGDTVLADSAYVQVVARLQLITTPADTARQHEADSARAQVLTDYGVTSEQLIAFAEVAGREPGRSKAIWEQIGAVVDSIRDADGLEPDVSVDDAGGTRRLPGAPPDEDTVVAPGIRTGEGNAADTAVAVDQAAARAKLDSLKAVRGQGRGKPAAGQPLRQP